MSPRAAGALAVVGGAALAVLGGALIPTPPWSVAGALVLVAATILLALGAIWLPSRSWSEPFGLAVAPSLQRQIRTLRVLQVVGSLLTVGTVAMVAFVIVTRDWDELVLAGFMLASAAFNLAWNRRTLRRLREADRAAQS